MKICMLTSGHSPLDDRIFYKEALSLVNKYDDITIAARYKKDYDEIGSIKIVGIPKGKGACFLNRISTLVKLYKKGLEVGADVYHCHEPDALLAGYLLQKKLKSRLVYDCHEYYPEAFTMNLRRWMKAVVKHLLYLFEGYLAKKCDFVITVNNILAGRFGKYNKNVICLPNYPRLSLAGPASVDTVREGLVYVGEICERKGCKKIIEAINLSQKSLNISFIGKMEEGFFESVSHLLNKSGKSRIEFLGEIEHERVFKMLGRYSIGFVLHQPVDPLDANCQPIKLFEYMACKLAVIAGDYPLVREIVTGESCGLVVDPVNVREIAKAIEHMMENMDETAEMSRRGKKAIAEKYNWENAEKKLLMAYAKIGEKMASHTKFEYDKALS